MLSPEQYLERLLNVAAMNEKNIEALSKDKSRRGFLPVNFRSYIRSISSYCLRSTGSLKTYADALLTFSALEKFEELLMFHQNGEQPSVFSNYSADDVDIVAVPIALGRFDLASSYISNVLIPAKSNPLWSTYVKGLNSLTSPTILSIGRSNFSGMEKHWALYIKLLECISQKIDTSAIREEITKSYLRCNGDGRLVEVTHIDPSGSFPVSWDLRLSYISELAAHET